MYSRKAEITLEFQNYIPKAPMQGDAMYKQACSNDQITINEWRSTWLDNMSLNKERLNHGTTSFGENSVGKLFGISENLPVIIAGSGPSLKQNGHLLKDRPKSVKLVSCLHNFHFFEDREVPI